MRALARNRRWTSTKGVLGIPSAVLLCISSGRTAAGCIVHAPDMPSRQPIRADHHHSQPSLQKSKSHSVSRTPLRVVLTLLRASPYASFSGTCLRHAYHVKRAHLIMAVASHLTPTGPAPWADEAQRPSMPGAPVGLHLQQPASKGGVRRLLSIVRLSLARLRHALSLSACLWRRRIRSCWHGITTFVMMFLPLLEREN